MAILALTIVVVTSAVIVMPIRIKLQFVKIECNMIQTLAYLLEHFQKTAIIKKVRKKAGLYTNYTQDSFILRRIISFTPKSLTYRVKYKQKGFKGHQEYKRVKLLLLV